jgi:hypothetical protein
LRGAGLDTIPGTAAEILDDDVRWVLTKGKLPFVHRNAPIYLAEHGSARSVRQMHDIAALAGRPCDATWTPRPTSTWR